MREKTPEHSARQPFGQIAILLHLGQGNGLLMPDDPADRAQPQQWLIARLNTPDPVVIVLAIARNPDTGVDAIPMPGLHECRSQLAPIIATREFIAAGRFTISDILLTEVLRLADSLAELTAYPDLTDYIARIHRATGLSTGPCRAGNAFRQGGVTRDLPLGLLPSIRYLLLRLQG